MNNWKDRGSKNCTLSSFFLGAGRNPFNFVGVANGSLNKWNSHEFGRAFFVHTGLVTVSEDKILLTKSKLLHEIVVDLCSSCWFLTFSSTGTVVFAPLVRQPINELSFTRTITAFKRSSVECDTLVPRMYRIVVALNATYLAVIKGVFKLAEDVHPYIHVCCTFLDDFSLARNVIQSEVRITICKLCPDSIESSSHPLICIIIHSIVRVELFKIDISFHLVFSTGTKTLDSPSIVVVSLNGISVTVSIRSNFNISFSNDASSCILFVCRECTNLAVHIVVLIVTGLILKPDFG
mmetsp:Transcript_26236/g.36976  ORF Transcript_26236/g.36976 Transcript_26236/m.36976 type:complete len:293 (+) Transcript_26236:460-1338(+)